jgi:hypothetical protein
LLSWSDVSETTSYRTETRLMSITLQVTLLSNSFPNLERLDVAVNPLCSSRQEGRKAASGFDNLRELVVGDCDISAWGDIVDMFGSLLA